jgi:hypothetical protein
MSISSTISAITHRITTWAQGRRAEITAVRVSHGDDTTAATYNFLLEGPAYVPALETYLKGLKVTFEKHGNNFYDVRLDQRQVETIKTKTSFPIEW